MSTVIMVIAIIVFAVIPSFKDRIISIKKLLISPAIFSYLFYQTLTETFHIDTISYSLIFGGLVLGVTLGYLSRYHVAVKVDRNQKLIWLPGTYLNLLVFCIIFSIHFAIGYLQATNPAIFNTPNFIQTILLFLLACSSSITIGASSSLYYKYLTAETFLPQVAK